MTGSSARNAARTITTNGVRWSRKSLNDKPARLAMMMLGGSPTRVAAPPMLEAKTSASRKGTGLIARRSQTRSVTGAISNTVVTLSRRAEAPAVIKASRIITRSADPFARLDAQMAMYSKTPVCRRTPTITIIPSSRKITFQSMPVSREKNMSSAPAMPAAAMTAAPPSAALTLLIFSVAMNR